METHWNGVGPMVIDLKKLRASLGPIYYIEGIGLSSNVYVIGEKEITLIDTGAGDEMNRLKETMERSGLSAKDLSKVILTHSHPDHIGGLIDLIMASSPTILIHPVEAEYLDLDEALIMKIVEGDVIETPGHRLTVIHTPGHTAGSICLYDSDSRILFSGDTVFTNGAFGRTDLPTGNAKAMKESLRRLTELNIDSLLPGHEEPVTENGNTHVKLSYEMARAYF